MTARGAIVLLLIGFATSTVGAVFKIQHWPYAGQLLVASSLLQAMAVIILAVKVSRYPGFKDLLDR
ncbi:MAG TPA: hypothetical protein PLB89_17515 [Flavobacteriales bacterium]|nr:hypothetical protein [Flavobacteriales bacterium]